jgi:hypothetical protein
MEMVMLLPSMAALKVGVIVCMFFEFNFFPTAVSFNRNLNL